MLHIEGCWSAIRFNLNPSRSKQPGWLRRGLMAAARIARALSGAAVLTALLCLAGTGFAQQRVVPPRTSPLSGRPDTEGAMRLVPPGPPAPPAPGGKDPPPPR